MQQTSAPHKKNYHKIFPNLGFFLTGLILTCFFLYQTKFSWVTFDDVKIEALKIQAITDGSRFMFDKAMREFRELSFLYTLKGDKNSAADMMLRAGFQYDKAGNYHSGLPLLKQVAYDKDLSPEVRSEALAYIVMSYSGDEKIEIMQAIFDDSNPIIREALGGGSLGNLEDLRRAAIHLLETAKSIHEYSYLDYILAARKSYLLLDDMENLNHDEVTVRREEILSLIQRGDEALKEEENLDSFVRGSFAYNFLPSGQSQKLQAFVVLAQISGRADNIYEQSATDVYHGMETIKATYYKDARNAPTYLGTESFIRFYYASMLANLHGAAYREEIQSIIAPTMLDTGNWGIANRVVIWKFYELELSKLENEQGSNYRAIVKLASLLPDLNQFILNKGWSNN